MVKTIRDIKKYWKYIMYSTGSRLKAEVANSYLNWLWWVLEPFFYMLIYTVIFGYIFESTELYFPVYIFIGNTMWTFFSRTINASVTMLRANEAIISKVYIPKYILVIIETLVNAFKMLVSFVLVAVMMIIFEVPVSIKILWVIPTILIFLLVSFGLGTILMHYGGYIEDLSRAINILLGMLMYFTGIFFSIETRVPEPFCTLLGVCNPVAFLLTSTRKAVMYNSIPDLQLLGIWAVLAFLLSIIGIHLVYKNENSYVKIM